MSESPETCQEQKILYTEIKREKKLIMFCLKKTLFPHIVFMAICKYILLKMC